MSEAFDFDPLAPQSFADPYPAYRVMRDAHPVYRREIAEHRVWPHYWMLSRAADVNDALADWQTWSSARGTLIDTDITLIPPNIFNMDPPRHDQLRDLLARTLTPRRVAGLETRVREIAAELLRSGARDGRIDAAAEFAHRIPTLTMCELMDLPESERSRFLKWNLDTLAGSDFTSPSALAAYAEMGAYWEELVAERRKQRGSDLISELLHARVDGEPLSDAEIGGFCSLLHDASQNTTMNMIAHSILALGRHPRARAQLCNEPKRWPRAIDELLRFVSPVQGLARTATRDVTLHGVTVGAGDQVLLLYGSANHDERAFADPETLDLDRDARSHWAFGHGIHHCLGSSVAKLEIRVALQVLLETVPDYEVDEAGVALNQLIPTRGVAHAPIAFAR